MIQSLHLENGVILLIEPIKNSEVASIGYWFTHGSRDENENEQGFSHFLEHMLFKGTRKRSAFAIASDIDRVGGILNAFTEKEACCYYCTVPKQHIGLAIDILSDMSFFSLLDEKEIENEKRVIINEIQSYLDSPEEVAYEMFIYEMWNKHPLSSKITGEVEDVKKIDKKSLEKFYRDRYNLSNLVISIAGNIEKDEIAELVMRNLSGITTGNFTVNRSVPTRSKSWKFVNNRFMQVQVYAGIDSFPYKGLKSFYSTLVFSTIFGEAMSSRLYQEIRETLGLCYSIYSFRSFYTDIASWTIYASTTPQMAMQLLQAIGKTLGDLFINKINSGEITNAKSHLKGSLVLTQEEMEVRMKRLYRLFNAHGTVLEFDDAMKMIDEVSPDEIDEIIHKYIVADRFNLLAYGNIKNKKIKNIRFDF